MADGFVLDLNRCTGCAACSLACTIENDLQPGVSWRQVVTFNEARHPSVPVHHLSLACNHCEAAPCMASCPALAYSRNADTGAVLIDPVKCIGCGYCAWTCPYDAPQLDTATGVMTKCTLCHPRLVAGGSPACVSACPTDALRFGDLDSAGGLDVVPGFPETPARPNVRFRPLSGSGPPTGGDAGPAPATSGPSKIQVRSEWPLALFTMLTAWLVALVLASEISGLRIPPIPFLAAAVAGLGLSTMHLGRPLRAWRAILNLRGSWLSREVAAYGVFVGAAAILLLLAPGNLLLAQLTVGAGLLCLFAMDRVYDVVRPRDRARIPMHSADALPTTLFLASVLSGSGAGTLLFGIIRGGLYLERKIGMRREGKNPRMALSSARMAAGFFLPGVAWLVDGGGPVVLAGVLAGELIDRLEFYGELEVPTPRRQAAIDLARQFSELPHSS